MRAFLAAVLVTIVALGAARAHAQNAPANPPQVQEFVKLLSDPAVRDWLERQREAAAAARPGDGDASLFAALGAHFSAIRQHMSDLADTLPRLPEEFGRASNTLQVDLQGRSILGVMLLLVGFVALGLGSQQLFIRAMTPALERLSRVAFDTIRDRVRVILLRMTFGLGVMVSGAVGMVGAFLVFDWPPLLREILINVVLAFLAQRLAMVASMVLLSPLAYIERFRIVPMDMAAAQFWHRRVLMLVAWFAFGAVMLNLVGMLGFSEPARMLVTYLFDLIILAQVLEVTFRRPEPPVPRKHFSRGAVTGMLAGFFVFLLFLRIANAMGVFWLLLCAAALPAAIQIAQRSISHLLRPPGHQDAGAALPSVMIVAIERGIRTLLIIAAAWALTRAWDLDMMALTASDAMVNRILRGVLSAIVILLLADFVWQLMKTTIDNRLQAAQAASQPDAEITARQARLRTLLPILRNILFIVIAAFAVMMALSALGVEIGPLIAGAGVVGVAVGFGAQTLVRDVISGMFYLLDDAFRIGEYIQAGNYKGTVEAFSLRSIKLRHHRGPLYTIPFGSLGAVQNMSRDWVIDKFSVGVTYDTDLDLVRKLVRQIGRELSQDKEIAHHIIEPLKMQGVEQFGDYAIQVRMKIMTKPGEQFVIRRRAFALIKKSFDANGVKFAFPTVQIAGGDEAASSAAVARQALELIKPAASS